MHDWTLNSIQFDWNDRRVIIDLIWDNKNYSIIAEDVIDLHVPQKMEWGRSVSVNTSLGPSVLDNDLQKFTIEMQSGDVIEIIASSFELPFAGTAPKS